MYNISYFKIPIIIILVGIAFRVFATMMKILHWKGADNGIIISTVVIIAGILMAVIKLILNRQVKQ